MVTLIRIMTVIKETSRYPFTMDMSFTATSTSLPMKLLNFLPRVSFKLLRLSTTTILGLKLSFLRTFHSVKFNHVLKVVIATSHAISRRSEMGDAQLSLSRSTILQIMRTDYFEPLNYITQTYYD
jgi:hypothetical protein